MARKKQTRRKEKNRLSKAAKASDKDETKPDDIKDKVEDPITDAPAVENTVVPSQESDVETPKSAENEATDAKDDSLKRKRENESKLEEDSKKKKTKRQGEDSEEKVEKEISIRIERW